ncbi:MAG: NHL repeat-containing protein [Bacteroidota bacterium]
MKQLPSALAAVLIVVISVGCDTAATNQPAPTVPPWENGQTAEAVLGQTTFTAGNSNAVSQNSINSPWGSATASNGTMFVVDQGSHRILRFDNATTKANGANADGELGQPSFTSTVWNYSAGGSTPSANGFETPTSIALDALGNLYVVDQGNGRVLRFNAAASKANGAAADAVFGRQDFTSKGFGTTQTTFFTPQAVAIDAAGNLYVADGSNHRVLRFSGAATKGNGAPADAVLGQPDFTTNTKANAANKLDNPISLAVDRNGNLYVGQRGNCRVSVFLNAASKANGAAADIVLGKPDFADGSVPTAATSSNIYLPYALAVDENLNLYVADGGFNRVLVFYNAPSKSNGASADAVIGKGDLVSSSSTGATAVNVGQPYGVSVHSATGKLFVSCFSNSRVLRFQAKSALHP